MNPAVRKKMKVLNRPPILVKVDPRPPEARVLVVNHLGETLLKVCLGTRPILARALPTLLEALAMWTGAPVKCALFVGYEEPWCAMGTFGVYGDERDINPLYQVEAVEIRPRLRKSKDITGMGEFRDLRQMEFCSVKL
jgi:hypothetical protein